MARNCYYPFAICHYYMLTLSCDMKAGLFKSPNGDQMVDAGNFRYLDRDLYFPNVRALQVFVQNLQVFLDRRLNVLQGFQLGLTLRPAARQNRAGHAVTFI